MLHGCAQVENIALDVGQDEEKFVLPNSPSGPLVALAFKLEEGKYGQLTYVRVYSGTLRKGSSITNVSSGKKHKVPRVVRTHSDELEDVDEVTVSGHVISKVNRLSIRYLGTGLLNILVSKVRAKEHKYVT